MNAMDNQAFLHDTNHRAGAQRPITNAAPHNPPPATRPEIPPCILRNWV